LLAAQQAAIETIPERERHLATHEGHLTFLNAIDGRVVTGDLIRARTFTGEAAALRERLGQLAGQGVTEVGFQPKGPDIARELTAFARMAGLRAA
jgi:5,10-methylenetetrahydromethanopterin reductase